MNKHKIVIGQTCGYYTVIDDSPIRTNKKALKYLCKCICGKERALNSHIIANSSVNSCGCKSPKNLGNIPSNFKDLSGQKFNKWTVIKRSGSQKTLNRVSSIWECKCDCGNVGHVTTGNLVTESSKSCGCLRNERVRSYRKQNRENSERQKIVTINTLYSNYTTRARKNKFDFNLSVSEFTKLILDFCFYCGRQEVQITKNKNSDKVLKHNGIDRKDPTKGYTLDNSVSCCKTCNYGKNVLTLDEWNSYIDKLVEYRIKLKDEKTIL